MPVYVRDVSNSDPPVVTRLSSSNAVYNTARAGSNLSQATASTTQRAGERFVDTPYYYCYQTYMAFNTTVPTGETLVGIELGVRCGTSTTESLQDVVYIHGTSASKPTISGTSMWKTAAALALLTPVFTGDARTVGTTRRVSTSNLLSGVKTDGWTTFVFTTKEFVDGTSWDHSPTLTENRYALISTFTSTTEDYRPFIVLYTEKDTRSNKVVYANRDASLTVNDNTFIDYLTKCGMDVTAVGETAIETHDFSTTDLIVVGSRGEDYTAHANIATIVDTGLPVISNCRHTSRIGLGMSTGSSSSTTRTWTLAASTHAIAGLFDNTLINGDTINCNSIGTAFSHQLTTNTLSSGAVNIFSQDSTYTVFAEYHRFGIPMYHFGATRPDATGRTAELLWAIVKHLSLASVTATAPHAKPYVDTLTYSLLKQWQVTHRCVVVLDSRDAFVSANVYSEVGVTVPTKSSTLVSNARKSFDLTGYFTFTTFGLSVSTAYTNIAFVKTNTWEVYSPTTTYFTTPANAVPTLYNTTDYYCMNAGTLYMAFGFNLPGGRQITDCGFCYNQTGTPTTEDTVVSLGAKDLQQDFDDLATNKGLTNWVQPGTIDLSLITGIVYVRAFATNASGTVYGIMLAVNRANNTLTGTGTAIDPHLIKTIEDFQVVSNYPTLFYKVANNIDGTGVNHVPLLLVEGYRGQARIAYSTFTATGTDMLAAFEYPFQLKAQLDGDNKVIFNLTSNLPAMDNWGTGFIGLIKVDRSTVRDSSYTVKDLHIINGSITGKHYAGGFLGASWALWAAGTPADSLKQVFITNCSFSGTVNAESGSTGGFAGYVADMEISGCHFSGVINMITYAGGFFGYQGSRSDIKKCSAIAQLNATGIDTNRTVMLGGFGSTFYAYDSYSVVEDCWCIADIATSGTATEMYYIGGFGGYISTDVTNCFCLTSITTHSTAGHLEFVGGFAAGQYAHTTYGAIETSYCSTQYTFNHVTPTFDFCDAFLGAADGSSYYGGTSYYNSDLVVSGFTTLLETGLTAVQMESSANFTTFDFVNKWDILTDNFPHLLLNPTLPGSLTSFVALSNANLSLYTPKTHKANGYTPQDTALRLGHDPILHFLCAKDSGPVRINTPAGIKSLKTTALSK